MSSAANSSSVNNTTFTTDSTFAENVTDNDGVNDNTLDDFNIGTFGSPIDGNTSESSNDQLSGVSNFSGYSAEYTYTIQRLDVNGNRVGDELFLAILAGDNIDFGNFEGYLIHCSQDGFAETFAGTIGAEYEITGIATNTPSVQYVCLTRGTLIKAMAGEVPIEDLSVGDKVLTMDSGYQPIRWIGWRRLSRVELEANPKLKPIRIRAGALGPNMPEHDLVLSPQHRVLIRNAVAMRMFDTAEVLIPANKLLTLAGIDIEWEADGVEDFHFLFDAYQIVWSNGAPTESLFTGPEALKAVSPEARAEIAALFPDIVAPGFVPRAARLIPEKGKLMKTFAQRMAKNNRVAVAPSAHH